MYLNAVILVVLQSTLVLANQYPLCKFFKADSLYPRYRRIPIKHKVDISIDIPVPPSPCILNTSSALDGFIMSNISYLTVFIMCNHMQIVILPIQVRVKTFIETLELTLIECNASYGDITRLAESKLVRLSLIKANILVTDEANVTNPCYGVDNVFRLDFDSNLDETLWTLLTSCKKLLRTVFSVSIKRIHFNLINDLYSFTRLQQLTLSDVSMDIFPEMHFEYFELEYNTTFPGVYSYKTPFTPRIPNFDIVLRSLDYSFNNISVIPSPITTFYIPLHIVLLHHNSIRSLDSLSFSTIRHVLKIDISFNYIETLPENLLKEQVTLQEIKFESNSIASIPGNFFKGLISLKNVNFADNHLTVLDGNLFQVNPSYKGSIANIDFANNQIRHVPNKMFWLMHVNKVSFRNNSLTSISPYILSVYDLDIADLSDNPIDGNAVANLAFSYTNYREGFQNAPPTLDFSNCNISVLPDDKNLSIFKAANYQSFFSSYKVIFKGNPINCTCNMRLFVIDLLSAFRFSPITDIANGEDHANNVIVVDRSSFDSWKCYHPAEYRGLNLMDIPKSQFYCRTMSSSCPDECSCFHYESGRQLIDCSRTNLTDIPSDIPLPYYGKPENIRVHTVSMEEFEALMKEMNETYFHLKFSHAQLITISSRDYLNNVKTLDVSFNKLTSLSTDILDAFKDQVNFTLDISNNRISSLPRAITSLHFEELRLSNNPYICDCNTLWMKNWIRDRRIPIIDWPDITCIDIYKRGRQYISVPDQDFVCTPKFETFRKVIVPAIEIGAAIVGTVFVLLLTYVYKQELKVLIFVYFGIHPFDKDERKYSMTETVDVFIAHHSSKTPWILGTLVKYLESKGFSVTAISRDSLLGFTYHENLRQMIERSKRIIICVENCNDLESGWFTTSWTLAKDKIKLTKTNYAVLLHLGRRHLTIKDSELKRYMSRGRLIQSRERIPLHKILYYMPVAKQSCHRQVDSDLGERYTNNPIIQNKIRWSAFVSYDTEVSTYIRFKLMPLLEQSGLILHIPDRDFEVGVPNEENYIKAVDGSMYTLFVLTNKGLSDEWRRFVFNIAREKSVSERSNHLLVIKLGALDTSCLSDELIAYVDNHACINTNDPLFEYVLTNTLAGGKNRLVV